MIDTTKEQVISFNKAAELIAEAKGRKRMSVSTLYCWAKRGLRGVVLETVQVGGKKATTREALDRFFRALTPEPRKPEPWPAVRPTQGSSRWSAGARPGPDAASDALDRLGL
jgi:hypothetical protein